jgi:hypothetical protein
MRRAPVRVAIVLLALAAVGPAAAQQYVWNVPSPEVLGRGSLVFEGYAYWGLEGPDYWYAGPRATVGLGGQVELGLNYSAAITPASSARVELALKWQPWKSSDGRWALTAGGIGLRALHGLDYEWGAFAFGSLSRSFASGATVSAGGYHYTRDVVAPVRRTGVTLTAELPLGKRWTLGADWLSGPEGYATAGFFYEVNPALYASAGYVFGNEGLSDGNHYLLFALSWYPR